MSERDAIVYFGSIDVWANAGHLVLGAFRRRWIGAVLLASVFLAAGAAAVVYLPRTYSTETRLLIKKNYVMPALAHPRRAVPIGSEAPAQSAAELVLSHDALVEIIRNTDLEDRWLEGRPALARAKDTAIEWAFGPVTTEERFEALVDLLAKQLSVRVVDEVITIRARWQDGPTARALVEAAVEAFLGERRRLDIETIADTHAILERSTQAMAAEVEARLLEMREIERRLREPETPVVPGTEAEADAEIERDPVLTALRGDVIAARLARSALEQGHLLDRERAEAEATARIAGLTERHPDVIATRRELERLREDPPALRVARAEEARRVAAYVAAGGDLADLDETTALGSDEGSQALALSHAAAGEATGPARGFEDASMSYARKRLEAVLNSYHDLTARLHDVRLELEVSEAAFAYRYTVTDPARLPRRADSPNVLLIVLGALVAGVAAGASYSIFAELRARSLLHPAELARHLGIHPPQALV